MHSTRSIEQALARNKAERGKLKKMMTWVIFFLIKLVCYHFYERIAKALPQIFFRRRKNKGKCRPNLLSGNFFVIIFNIFMNYIHLDFQFIKNIE